MSVCSADVRPVRLIDYSIVVCALLTSLETRPMGCATGENAGYYAVRSGLKTGVFCTYDEVVPLIHGVKGTVNKRFPTREEAEVFATAERLYAVDRVERNEVLETWDKKNQFKPKAFPSKKYKFFASRQEAEEFLHPNVASDAEASPANVTSDSTSEDAGKVPAVWCWCSCVTCM
jgi:viroplasmin and RNaseH domain-containing protein